MNILIIPTNDWMRAPGHGHIDLIAEQLAERGHNVFAWHFDYYRNEPIKRKPKKIKLIGSRTLSFGDPSFFFVINALFQFPTLFKKIRELKINVVINENILFGLMAFVVSGNKVLKIFDFSDYFPESASVFYKNDRVLTKKLIEAVVLSITKLNIKRANVCLAVCRSLINVARNIDGAKTCYMLTNGVDASDLLYTNKEITRINNPRFTKNNLLIMGIIDEWLDLITPLESLSLLRQEFPTVKLVIVGPWRKQEHKKRIQKFITENKLCSNVEITDYVTQKELVEHLNEAICCMIPYTTDSFSSKIRLPEKLFMYSAFGKPILSVPLPEIIALGCKHVQYYKNSVELCKKISIILRDESMRNELSIIATKFAKKHDVSILAENLEKILVFNLSKQK